MTADNSTKTGKDEPRFNAASGVTGFRPVTPEDESLIFAVYCSSRIQEMSMVPWSDDQKYAFLKMQFNAQTAHYQSYYPDAQHSVILFDEMAVGRIQIDRDEEAIHILDITILPAYRGKGIGTPIIRDLMRESAATKVPVNIYVENYNPSVSLFQRLGFVIKENDDVNLLFEWRPEVNYGEHNGQPTERVLPPSPDEQSQ